MHLKCKIPVRKPERINLGISVEGEIIATIVGNDRGEEVFIFNANPC